MKEECQLDANGAPLKRATCPTCGYGFDSATSIETGEAARPREGDLSLCLKCGELLTWNDQMRLVPPSLEVLMNLETTQPDTAKDISRAQAMIRKTRPLAHKYK